MRLAAAVFGDDKRVDEAVCLQGVDESDRVGALREPAGLREQSLRCAAGDGCREGGRRRIGSIPRSPRPAS